MRKVLVTGANGFLGQHLCLWLMKNNMSVIATGKGESHFPATEKVVYESLELTNHKDVKKLLKEYKPDIVVHNAAMSKPDICDKNREMCRAVNVETTRYILEEFEGHLIYLSSDFVFG